MRSVTLGSAVVVRAPAKVNLFLEVLAKRPDGYHDIATLMLAVRLFDTLVFERQSEGLRLECSRPDLSTGPDNLIMKAARLLQDKTGCRLGAQIRLVKRIPLAAGLAGGSTDAAAALTGLNQLWQLGCSVQDLAQWSGEIGSDIPFFFHTPAAWCTGRGEKVSRCSAGSPARSGAGVPEHRPVHGGGVPECRGAAKATYPERKFARPWRPATSGSRQAAAQSPAAPGRETVPGGGRLA